MQVQSVLLRDIQLPQTVTQGISQQLVEWKGIEATAKRADSDLQARHRVCLTSAYPRE